MPAKQGAGWLLINQLRGNIMLLLYGFLKTQRSASIHFFFFFKQKEADGLNLREGIHLPIWNSLQC